MKDLNKELKLHYKIRDTPTHSPQEIDNIKIKEQRN